jgi:hypothetical protein
MFTHRKTDLTYASVDDHHPNDGMNEGDKYIPLCPLHVYDLTSGRGRHTTFNVNGCNTLALET